jgi:hypothetical protein
MKVSWEGIKMIIGLAAVCYILVLVFCVQGGGDA